MKLAFVTPWYGRDIPGGAEAEARRTAVHLLQAGFEVEVLTTCIRDLYADWGKNHHKPGTERVDGVLVRRFAVGKRNKPAFDSVNLRLINGQPISAAEEEIFNQEMFRCPDLYAYIEKHKNDYLFLFIPYMFASTYFGAQICPEHSIVLPCLHDEGYARLQIHQQVLAKARALLFQVEAEKQLADALFPPQNGQMRKVIGVGVDTNWQADGARFRQKYGLADTPFVLYVGRREPGKNTPLLIDYWLQYKQRVQRDVKLILIGPGDVHLPPTAAHEIVDLGFVSVQDKYDAYAAANLLCQPSVHESFSIVLMESWLAGTPVLVHGRCAVTVEHCQKSNGGLYFTNQLEFGATLDYLLTNRETAVTLGQQGKKYVLQNYQWETIISRYKEIIHRISNE